MARTKRAIFFVFFCAIFAAPYLCLVAFDPLESNISAFFMLIGFASVAYWLVCVEDLFRLFTPRQAFSKALLTTHKIFWLGIALRICLLPLSPCDDIYRYLWEGKMWWQGFNPYHLAPDSPSLILVRDQFWPMINHPHLTTLYPPLTQILFALAAKIHYSILCFKLIFIGFDVGTYFVLKKIIRNMCVTGTISPVTQTQIEALYFLNPLLILEIAGRGHFDSMMVFFNTLLLLTLSLPPLAIFLGALSKITSLVLFPVYLLNTSLKKAVLWSCLLGSSLLIVLYASGMFEMLGKFTTDFHYNGIVPSVLDLALPFLTAPTKKLLLGMLLMITGSSLFLKLRGQKPAIQCLYFMGLFLLFTPTLHTWYLLWILPFAVITHSRAWLLLGLTSLITYLVYARMGVSGEWKEIPWLGYPEFIPPLGLWLYLKFKHKIQS